MLVFSWNTQLISYGDFVQAFPEVLLVQLLTVMLHPDVEARHGAHQIFSILLFPNSYHPHECSDQHKKWHTHTSSASASVIALLEKLRRGSSGTKTENHGLAVHDDCKVRDTVEDWKQGCSLKNSPNFYKLSSIIDKTTGSTSLTEMVSICNFFHEYVWLFVIIL